MRERKNDIDDDQSWKVLHEINVGKITAITGAAVPYVRGKSDGSSKSETAVRPVVRPR